MTLPELDAAQIARAAEGEKRDMEELLRRLEPELRGGVKIPPRWARSLDPEDVLQVSFLETYLRIGTLRDRTPAGLRAWLRRLVQNNLTDAIRGLERDRRPDPARRTTQGPDGQSARTLLGLVAGELRTAGTQVAIDEQVARMKKAIERLPPS